MGMWEKIGIGVAVVLVLGFIAWKAVGNTPGSSAFMFFPGGPDVSVSLAEDSPQSSILIANTTGNKVANFVFRAQADDFIVNRLALKLPNWSGYDQWDSVKRVSISYSDQQGVPQIRTIVPKGSTIQFEDLGLFVLQSDVVSSAVSVRLDFHGMNPGPADHGDQIMVVMDSGRSNATFEAIGLTSGLIDTQAAYNDISAHPHRLYKTLVRVTQDNSGSSSTLVPGAMNDLYTFRLTADPSGSVGVKRLTFRVTINDQGQRSAGVTLGNFVIVTDGVDITTTAASITGAEGNVDSWRDAPRVDLESSKIGHGTTWVNVQFGDLPTEGDHRIAAGTTTTWLLRAEAGTGFMGRDDDSVTVELLGGPFPSTTLEAAGLMSHYIEDNDPTLGEWVTILANVVGNDLRYGSEFIWSDYSALAHDSSITDNEGKDITPPDSSGDWAGGELAPGFPLNPFTLIA